MTRKKGEHLNLLDRRQMTRMIIPIWDLRKQETVAGATIYIFFAQSVNHFASSLVDGNVDVVDQALINNGPLHGKGRSQAVV